ncbi:uncharacterized protein LOC122859896 [Aphidius gifuensis]|uniref:uncharacterized protein LOC122859896 n=1 Tax=Aphidius gifuensis TaxID=684658 RepID=UPI001CDD504F|nr:uncharacterized protein LOC122859896 [Aphidius gifuensis]
MDHQKAAVAHELHSLARRNYTGRHVDIRGLDETWQADLVDMQASVNRNYKYLLTIIDVFSKFAWAITMKSKTGKDVTAAIKSVLEKERILKNLYVDQGKEFYNKEFEALMRKYKINMYSTYSNLKASIVERFNRTLRNKMWEKFTYQGSYKCYTPNFTTEVFTIKEVKNTDPVTYKLIDYEDHPIEGGFYEEELTKVKYPDIYLIEKIVKKRGDKLYVKWLGFDDTHNS